MRHLVAHGRGYQEAKMRQRELDALMKMLEKFTRTQRHRLVREHHQISILEPSFMLSMDEARLLPR